MKEIKGRDSLKSSSEKIRKSGGGRKSATTKDIKLAESIEHILSETTAGDPLSFIKWTCKSVRNIGEQLCKDNHDVSYRTVHRLLVKLGYSLQSNHKSLSQSQDLNRNEQFQYINRKLLSL